MQDFYKPYILRTKKHTGTRNLLCLLAGIVLSLSAAAQPNITEINNSIARADNDSQKLKGYQQIFKLYEFSNPDSSIYYLKQGLALFTAHNYKPGIAKTLTWLGGMYATQGTLEIAKRSDEEALKIFTELNDKRNIANAHNVLGVIEGRKSNYTEAIGHFIIALKLFESVNDTNGLVGTYIKLGAANEMSDNLDKALEYFNKGLSLANGHITNNVISIMNDIGVVYSKKKDYHNAMTYFRKALAESEDPSRAELRILPLTNLGAIFNIEKDTAKALSYYREALDIAVQEKLPDEQARLLLNTALIFAKSNPDKALALMNDALQKTIEIGQKQLEADVLDGMKDLYTDKGDYKTAFSLLSRQKVLVDSIFNVDKEQAIANVEGMYEFDKLNSKLQQLELSEQKHLQRRNTIITIAIFLTISLLIVIFLLWKTRRFNTELAKRELELQKTNMVKDKLFSIIGHDLVGAIGSMPVALALSRDKDVPQEDKDIILDHLEENAIASFDTLQNLLNWGKAQIQGIIMKQANINTYSISGEVLRLINITASNKQITINNNIAPGTIVYADPDHFKFVLRNLLSNAIKYSKNSGVIEINAGKSADATHIIFSVKDDGVGISSDKQAAVFQSLGFSTAGTANEKGNGIGLRLCKDFVTENGGAIWVESETGKGATFYFSLKTQQ